MIFSLPLASRFALVSREMPYPPRLAYRATVMQVNAGWGLWGSLGPGSALWKKKKKSALAKTKNWRAKRAESYRSARFAFWAWSQVSSKADNELEPHQQIIKERCWNLSGVYFFIFQTIIPTIACFSAESANFLLHGRSKTVMSSAENKGDQEFENSLSQNLIDHQVYRN